MYLTWAKLIKGKSCFFTSLTLWVVLIFTTGIVSAQKTADRGGNGGSGNPTPTPTFPNPLPQNPPAPDIIYRESFGAGPYQMRPASGKGTMKSAYLWEKIRGFWIEYPGSKNTQWMTLDTNEGWRYCGITPNPYELFSPLQVLYTGEESHGCAASGFDETTGISPTALIPFAAPTVPYEISIEGYPTNFNGTFISVGFTNSSILNNNLEAFASVALLLYPEPAMTNLPYELKVGATVVASGTTEDFTFNRMKVRVDPVNKTIGASINEKQIGTFPIDVGRPRYAGFEGVGLVDDFVIRKLP